MRTYDSRKKKSTNRPAVQLAPIQIPQSSEIQAPTIQAKSNEEGLAEWATRREKWARLGTPWTEVTHLQTPNINRPARAQVPEPATQSWVSNRPPIFKSPLILRQTNSLKHREKKSSAQQSNLQQPQHTYLQHLPDVAHSPVHLAQQSVMSHARTRHRQQDISVFPTHKFPSTDTTITVSKVKTPIILRAWESSPEDPQQKKEWEEKKKKAILETIQEKLPHRPQELQMYDEIYANIGVFLEDKGRFLKRLIDLETSLKQRASEKENPLQYGDLVDELTQFEKSINLNVDSVTIDEKDVFGPAIIFGTISANYFLNKLVSQGITWEDPSFVSHGGLSHRIQWYAIAKEVLNNPQPYGNKSPKELYVTVPQYGRYQETNPNDPREKSPDRSLWDILVDTVPTDERAKEQGLIFSDTGRSPDTINQYFNSMFNKNQESKSDFPNLGEAISLYGEKACLEFMQDRKEKLFQDIVNPDQDNFQVAYWHKSKDQKK